MSIRIDPSATTAGVEAAGVDAEWDGPECGGGIMERDHRTRTHRCSVLALALVCIELTSQVLCLSVFPSSGSVTALSVANDHARTRNESTPVGSATSLLRRFLRDVFDAPMPGRAEPDDEDQEQSDWPQVVLIVRRTSPVSTSDSLTSPTPPSSFQRIRVGPHSRHSRPVAERSIQLCRLTC
jgi:hypothetical protein